MRPVEGCLSDLLRDSTLQSIQARGYEWEWVGDEFRTERTLYCRRWQPVSFGLGRDPKCFDILPAIPGVDFDAAWERRVETVIDAQTGLKANFISADDLIASRLASGRPQDLADADAISKTIASQRPRAKESPLNLPPR